MMTASKSPLWRKNKVSSTLLLYTIIVLISSPDSAFAQAGANARSCQTLRSMARIYMACADYNKAQPLIERAVDLLASNPSSDATQSLCLTDLRQLMRFLAR